jgi:hypothetical protein
VTAVVQQLRDIGYTAVAWDDGYLVTGPGGQQFTLQEDDPVAQARIQSLSDAGDAVQAAIANLELADANWATLTAAQKDAAMHLAVKATAKLARYTVRRLDLTPAP